MAAIALTATVALSLATAAAFGSTTGDGVAVEVVDESPAEVRESWTPALMLRAAADGSPSPAPFAFDGRSPATTLDSTAGGDFTPEDTTAFPYRVHGKVFFRSGGQGYSCSGTLIDSAGRNVVATAGHCVYDREVGRFVEDLTFVPAWNGNAPDSAGKNPFGRWAARKIVTSSEYRLTGQLGSDIGFFTVEGEPSRGLGGRKLIFGLDAVGRQVTILGYPAEPSSLFDGREMQGCQSQVVGRDNGNERQLIFPAALWARPCSMGSGSSGGGWITSNGFLASVVSYGYCPGVPGLCDSTFGPVMGDVAKALYRSDPIGGSRRPTVAVSIASGPAPRAGRRSVSFDVGGSGSTPVSRWCRLDRRPASKCSGTVTFRNLEPGRHVFGVRVIDQTGRRSVEEKRSFVVRSR